MPRAVTRVVVRRVDNLGDIVIALPTIGAIRKNYPASELTLMVRDEHRVLCAGLADNFIPPCSSDEFEKLAGQYDVAFNIEYFGPGNHAKQIFRPHGLNLVNAVPGKRRRPMAQHLLSGVAAFGLSVPRFSEPRIQISQDLRKRTASWLRTEGLAKKNNLWIGIHIGSRVKEKCWPEQKFVVLARWLHRTLDAQLFFFGSNSETSAIQTVRSALPAHCSRTIVNQPLDLVAGVLSKMDVLIGNDSGIGHLASAVRTPTVSIFGPTMPSVWRPAGRQSVVVHKPSRQKQASPKGPTVGQVKQGILLSIYQHVSHVRYPVLDQLRLASELAITRTTGGVIIRRGKRGPACLVTDGWRRVKRILACVDMSASYSATVERFPDAEPLLGLLILHGIIIQGRK